ncbi:TIGR03619 family F420-dependent LLM class oxidoreductase [Mycobacteroides chelonae]|uniref:TIGR03619 family F420-dependent LLM class oxidoreductase n=1 Tax=Mycobacteroides chelonae TaxID=1774 RepID=UPI0008A84279|nr:TIGR03619 family F420-dependent LLM class oxidoreductase [Mycobacteroides chelonae]OHU64675.1 LLM class F420-dependent oxidoreductase [Mycobacteroides chelonae]
MQFGVAVPNYGAEASADKLRKWAEAIEHYCFDYAMVTDHVTQPAQVRRVYSEDFFEALTSLSFLAAVTSQVRIGTTVTVLPLRHPLLVARSIATIDRLSDGRVVFGIGVGGSEQEYTSLGLDFARRGALADEYLDVITQVWAGAKSFTGPTVRFDDLLPSPLPTQPGGPPIWVGGHAKAVLRRVVRFGAAWHPTFPTLESLTEGVRLLTELASNQGREVPTVAPRIALNVTDKPVASANRPLGVGTADQVRQDLLDLERVGATAVIVDPVKHRFLYENISIPDSASELVAQDGTELETLRIFTQEVADIRNRKVRV